MTYTTDEEYLETLEYTVEKYSKVPVQATVLCVVSTQIQANYLSWKLIEKCQGVWKSAQNAYENGFLYIRFITDNTDPTSLQGARYVAWYPMSDRIPAKLINMIRSREGIGRCVYEKAVRKWEVV